jgi:hypothetical protein
MDTEDLEMHDMTKERQEEEREEEEETSFDWDSFVNNLENFSDNASQYEGNLPNLPIPPHRRPEFNKNIAFETFIRKTMTTTSS